MANATPSRLGQINQSGDAEALFLKVFSGEVLAAFAQANVFLDRTVVRTISSGKSAQFPATWRSVASYHTPGAEILGVPVSQNEKIISIDDLLVAPAFIALIDEAMAHFDLRSQYSKECGLALAYQLDKNLAQVGLLAARSAATITGGDAGSSLINASYSTDGVVLAGGLFLAAQTLDQKNVPADGERNAFFLPAQYYLLAQNTTAINTFYGGQGAYATGEIVKIAGITIVKTNHLPSTNVVTGNPPNGFNSYTGNFSTTSGLVMHKQAVGTVKLLDMATEMAYDIRRQGTLIVCKYALGSGVLRPEAAVELKTS